MMENGGLKYVAVNAKSTKRTGALRRKIAARFSRVHCFADSWPRVRVSDWSQISMEEWWVRVNSAGPVYGADFAVAHGKSLPIANSRAARCPAPALSSEMLRWMYRGIVAFGYYRLGTHCNWVVWLVGPYQDWVQNRRTSVDHGEKWMLWLSASIAALGREFVHAVLFCEWFCLSIGWYAIIGLLDSRHPCSCIKKFTCLVLAPKDMSSVDEGEGEITHMCDGVSENMHNGYRNIECFPRTIPYMDYFSTVERLR